MENNPLSFVSERILGLSRLRYHHPKYPGERSSIAATPYLTLPFRQDDLNHQQIRPSQPGIGRAVDYEVSDGWWYSSKIPFKHLAVDFELPYGFPVAAPCDGYAMSSYYAFPFAFDGKPKTNDKGEVSHFGMGYFVQIYNPEQNRFVQLGHLSDVDKSIPFSIPEKRDGKWIPTNNVQMPEVVMSPDNRHVAKVRTGDTIGFVGVSGLTYGEGYQEGHDRPMLVDPNTVETISYPHIHFDEWMRNFDSEAKDWRRDPYDIYKTSISYPTHTNELNIGREPIFLTDQSNRPIFADQ